MSSKAKQTQVQVQKLTHHQILNANIIQMNNTLLEQRIINELEKNPTLEIIEDKNEEEIPLEDEDETEDSDEEFDWDELDSDSDRFEINKQAEEYAEFLITNHSAPKTMIDKVNEQLVDINLSDDQLNVAHEIIGNLDGDGYFKIEPILIGDRLNKTEEEVLAILKIIQSLNPRGIASRDLRECMLLQIDQITYPLAYQIIDRCFSDFSKKSYESICSKLDCDLDELKASIEIIKKINPKPGDGLSTGEKEYVIPDLILEKRNSEWVIHVNDNSMYELQVSKEYSNMLDDKSTDKATAKFIKEKMDSAHWFIDAIKNRRVTMLKVMDAIIRKQKNVFQKDKQELVPMILKDIADELDLDISTISRSTRGKYVQVPWGIFEIKDFFSESIYTSSGEEISNTIVKNKIKEIIEKENKDKPLDDQTITGMLIDDGYVIARRTVAKYRAMMGISRSKLRREIT